MGFLVVCFLFLFYLMHFLLIYLDTQKYTTGKTIALAIRTFISIVVSLLFNTLSTFVIAFLPKSFSELVLREETLASRGW